MVQQLNKPTVFINESKTRLRVRTPLSNLHDKEHITRTLIMQTIVHHTWIMTKVREWTFNSNVYACFFAQHFVPDSLHSMLFWTYNRNVNYANVLWTTFCSRRFRPFVSVDWEDYSRPAALRVITNATGEAVFLLACYQRRCVCCARKPLQKTKV